MKRHPPLLRRNNDKCDYRRGDNAAAVSRLGGGQIRRVARRKRHQLYSVLARGIWPEPSGPERPVAREPDCLRDHLSPINSVCTPPFLRSNRSPGAQPPPLSVSRSFRTAASLLLLPASSSRPSRVQRVLQFRTQTPGGCRSTLVPAEELGVLDANDCTRARTGSYQSGLSEPINRLGDYSDVN